MENNKLPPLPGSDGDSLRRSKTAREFWAHNEINTMDEPELRKCDHDFKYVSNGVQCKKCNFGLLGYLEIRDGSLYNNGERIGI